MGITLFSGCTQRAPCPKIAYPKLEAIKKIPRVNIEVLDGAIRKGHTKIIFATIEALRISENYYYTLIGDYQNDFNKKKVK